MENGGKSLSMTTWATLIENCITKRSVLLSVDVSKIDPLGRTDETYLEDPSGAIYNR